MSAKWLNVNLIIRLNKLDFKHFCHTHTSRVQVRISSYVSFFYKLSFAFLILFCFINAWTINKKNLPRDYTQIHKIITNILNIINIHKRICTHRPTHNTFKKVTKKINLQYNDVFRWRDFRNEFNSILKRWRSFFCDSDAQFSFS